MGKEFSALFPFCGLGAGARGFLDAVAHLGHDGEARFVNLGGIDVEPLACADFEYLTGGRALQADMAQLSPAELRAFAGARRPDCVFLSPPCKGFSRLLSTKTSQTDKYQALNRLVLQGLFLICETWDAPPPAIIIENVPGIMSRGAPLLAQARQLLVRYGYVFHEGTHDCGAIGGLGQHRRRFLMVARRPADVPLYIYRPALQRVKGCGEILGPLPLPEDPAAGPLHRLPRLSWLNYVRLALIPAGGDWRDLPAQIPAAALKQTARAAYTFAGRPGLFGVNPWTEPLPTVTGTAAVSSSNAVAAVADPRLGSPLSHGGFAVADPRIPQLGIADMTRGGALGVIPWDHPAPCITGNVRAGSSNTPGSVADPRFRGSLGVIPWTKPARTVAGESHPSNGGASVSDPRIGLGCNPNAHRNKYAVQGWNEAAKTVIGATRPGSGGPCVADPRLTCAPRAGVYGVISWQEAADTIIGNARIDNGRFAVADPRKPLVGVVPVIVAADDTWHRPMSTLELAALQGIPATVRGRSLELAGSSSSGWRERIGNAVPVQAAQAIAETILKALLAGSLGTWFLSAEGIWVRRDGHHEELHVEACPPVATLVAANLGERRAATTEVA